MILQKAFGSVLDPFVSFLRILIDSFSELLFLIAMYRVGRRRVPPLSVEDQPILLESAVSLARKIRAGELTSEQVVKAFIGRINEIGSLNAVVGQNFEEALTEARRVDTLLSSGSEPDFKSKPFLGIPFSTKEGIKMKGLCQSYGLLARKHFIAPTDADVIRSLKESGGIPLCVTNVSELGLWWESSNLVYGTTCNPYDSRRTAGGSSGGEAALQASCGISISIGSDSGGSIRIPASFCGLFGHKPSPGLTSVRGANTIDPPLGSVSEIQCIGPLCRHAEDLIPIFKVIIGPEKSRLMNLDGEVLLTKLNYYFLDLPVGTSIVSPLNPEVRQAMLRVVDFLENNFCVNVIPVRFDKMRNAMPLFMCALSKESHGVPMSDYLSDGKGSVSLIAEWLRWFSFRPRHTLPILLQATMEKLGYITGRVFGDSQDIMQSQLSELRGEIENLLGQNGVLICPVHPTTAPFLFQSYTRPFNFIYTGIFNALQLPATTVPVGIDQEGLPLSVQIVASNRQDRLTLAVAKCLERPFGGWVPPFRDDEHNFVY